jgi:hypothetical protein
VTARGEQISLEERVRPQSSLAARRVNTSANWFERCRFDAGIDLSEAHIRSLAALGCVIPTLAADELESDHTLYLVGSHLDRLVVTDGRIRGGVDLTDATLSNELMGDRLSVTGDVFLARRRSTLSCACPALRLVGKSP